MVVRSVRFPSRARLVAVLIAVPVLLAGAACGGASTSVTTGTPAAAAPTTVSAPGPSSTPDGAADVVRPPGAKKACALVPTGEIDAATGLRFTDGEGTESARRSVCAFSAARSGGTGLSVGVEPGERFDAKAAASRRSLGVPGTDVAGLGERALFFYSDADLPEGVGGVLVQADGSTIDITLQGLASQERTREAAVAIARVAVGNL
ncbi:hypothetical protein PSU4_47130 [Pseudonocardia sulfidoxydans NBRC 16205]|uniref:DUF3558 domain-containing protein n=1 Tax=Pseudonocardia sulfidoxydans NBRC 16205 TaxID=1223511 RepID=A0A511DLR5_9PSEU|nr:DUF3558 domain-containing protein [Pseudonocardia sulfidoxydans]GEL25759.1 hypothetical protein PSU4_47130 [Pseudonocardia sulfidoxydans NBRC 16205]